MFTDKVSRKRLIWCRLWEIPAKLINKQALIRFHGTKQFKRESPFRSASGIPRASEKPLRKGYCWKCVDVPQPGMHNIYTPSAPLFVSQRLFTFSLWKKRKATLDQVSCSRYEYGWVRAGEPPPAHPCRPFYVLINNIYIWRARARSLAANSEILWISPARHVYVFLAARTHTHTGNLFAFCRSEFQYRRLKRRKKNGSRFSTRCGCSRPLKLFILAVDSLLNWICIACLRPEWSTKCQQRKRSARERVKGYETSRDIAVCVINFLNTLWLY